MAWQSVTICRNSKIPHDITERLFKDNNVKITNYTYKLDDITKNKIDDRIFENS